MAFFQFDTKKGILITIFLTVLIELNFQESAASHEDVESSEMLVRSLATEGSRAFLVGTSFIFVAKTCLGHRVGGRMVESAAYHFTMFSCRQVELEREFRCYLCIAINKKNPFALTFSSQLVAILSASQIMLVMQYPHVWQLLQSIVLLNAIGFCGSVVADDDFNFNLFLLAQSD